MLGEAFYDLFNKDYNVLASDIDVNEDWLHFLDFRDFENIIKTYNFKPVIFHLGAITSLEECDLDEDKAYSTNTIEEKTQL